MTVPAAERKAGPFSGNGSTTAFPFDFKVFTAADVKVVFAHASGVETVLDLDSDYSVSLNADQDATPGGAVTYPLSGSALTSSQRLSIAGAVSYEQETNIPTGGNFNPTVLENALDKLSMQTQQLAEAVSRSAKVPISSSLDADALVSAITRVAQSVTNLDTVADNIADVNEVADNIAEIVAAPGYAASAAADAASALSSKNAASSSASAASSSASAASGSAAAAAASAVSAADAVASANIPPSLAGQAEKFLQVKDDETGYELVSSVAAPAFFGFKLSADLSSLDMTYGRDDYNVEDFATWTMSENVTFRVNNNNLEMVL